MFTQLMLGLALVTAAPAPKEAPKKEVLSVIGSWEPEKITVSGMEAPLPPGAAIRFRFHADGTMNLIKGLAGGMSDGTNGTFTTDTKKTLAEIDIKFPEGKGETLKGIFKMEGEKLIICATDDKGDRPTEFTSPAGTKTVIFTMKRINEK